LTSDYGNSIEQIFFQKVVNSCFKRVSFDRALAPVSWAKKKFLRPDYGKCPHEIFFKKVSPMTFHFTELDLEKIWGQKFFSVKWEPSVLSAFPMISFTWALAPMSRAMKKIFDSRLWKFHRANFFSKSGQFMFLTLIR
jgi:hypothetical protein